MDSLIFELHIIFYFQLFLSANVRHRLPSKVTEQIRNNAKKRLDDRTKLPVSKTSFTRNKKIPRHVFVAYTLKYIT